MKKMIFLSILLLIALGLPVLAETNGTITIGTTDTLSYIDPAEAYDFHTWEIIQNTFDTLLVYEPGTNKIVPGLAKELPKVTAGGKEWTFKLREGLAFSDGTPFDASVVKYSIDRVFATGGSPSWLVVDFVEHVDMVDKYTVKFVLKQPISYFPALVSTVTYSPVNPKIFPLNRTVADPSNIAGISLGAYKIEKLERGNEIVMAANPAYYGQAPKNKKIIIKYYEDSSSLRKAIEKGEIDFAWKGLTPTDFLSMKKNPALKSIETSGAQIRYLCFVCNRQPFNNKVLREAVACAVDRKSVVDNVFLGTVEPLYSMIPNGMVSHKDSFKNQLGEYNIAKAKELLASAGYNEKNPFAFDLWYTPTHYGDTEADVAKALKKSLEATGVIKVTLKSAEWGAFTGNFGSGPMNSFLLGWYPDYGDPDDYVAPFVLSSASESMGIFYFDPKMDALIVKAQTTLIDSERKKIYEQIQDYWATEVPTCPLFQGKLVFVTRSDISGTSVNPLLMLDFSLLYRE